jgi:hypothetical protein
MHFISFAGFKKNNSHIHKALLRIKKQAYKLNLFDTINCYTEEYLQSQSDFWNKHYNFITANQNGYGLFLWKPYIIKKTLEQINNNDWLIYCDAGCDLLYDTDISDINKDIILKKLQNKIFLAYCMHPLSHYTKYTKNICYKFFNIDQQTMITHNIYMAANRIIIKKTPIIMDLINEWYDTMSNNYIIFDDSKTSTELSSFVQSRWDQMILNFILYKYELLNINNNANNINIKFFRSVLKDSRNRSGISNICKNEQSCVCGCCIK